MNPVVYGVLGLAGALIAAKLWQAGAPPPGPPEAPTPPDPTPSSQPNESDAQLAIRYQRSIMARAERQAAETRDKQLVDDWAKAQPVFWNPPKPPGADPKV